MNIPSRYAAFLTGVTAVALAAPGVDAYGQQSYLELLDDYASEIEVASAPPAAATDQNALSVSGAVLGGTAEVLHPEPPAATGQGLNQAQFEAELRDLHPASYRVYSALAAYEQQQVYRIFKRHGSFDDAIGAIRTTINAHND